MQIESFFHRPNTGWSVRAFPALDSPTTLVTVFGASAREDIDEPLRELLAAYPMAHIIGGSSAGEIFGSEIHDRSLSVAVCRFERTVLRSVSAPVDTMSASELAGRTLAESLKAPDLRAILLISDGTRVNGSDLLRGLNSVVGPEVVVTGGLAGDGARFERTWVISDHHIAEGRASAVGFYGEHVRVGHGSKGGWDHFGPERIVTRSTANVLFELDGRPALTLYKEYLGDRASGLPGTALLFPLALRSSSPLHRDKTIVRTILAVDEKAQSMTFAGDIPEGGRVQLMRANFDRLIDGATEAARLTAVGGVPGAASLAIAISCVGRRLALGQRTEEEIEAIKAELPADTHVVGFYSYGEISPYTTGKCDLHNQTMTLTRIQET